ncbi:MAG: hypothetical protein OFPI_25110 [Osedax symbiont Rs2]|nr:MAG: hypothetical protein OFPI_25110 [Osedax symbiont Rs2]
MFKKIIAAMLLPIPMVMIIIAIGFFLLWFSNRQRLGKWMISSAALMLALFSATPVANLLISPLENHYPTYDLSQGAVKFVMVLGSGHVSDPKLPVTSQIGSASMARLLEGIRIYKANPGSKLIVSGWGGADPVPNAVVVAQVAIALGVPEIDIMKEPRAKDTHDEASLIKPVIGDADFALVTSAAHMPRAVALFKQQGMSPFPAPANYLFKQRPGQSISLQFSARNLAKSESAIHEYLGLAWSKLRGQI